MKLNKVLLNIASVFSFLFGALYIFSLVFIPIGIYCFSAGKKFSHKADHLLDNYSIDKKSLQAFSIFVSVVCFPFGLIALVAYFRIYSNNVKIENVESVKSDVAEPIFTQEIEQETEQVNSESEKQETESEKLEKLEKLRNFKEKGIITEEEFEMAKQQMFGEDANK